MPERRSWSRAGSAAAAAAGPPQSPHVTSGCPITAAPAHIKRGGPRPPAAPEAPGAPAWVGLGAAGKGRDVGGGTRVGVDARFCVSPAHMPWGAKAAGLLLPPRALTPEMCRDAPPPPALIRFEPLSPGTGARGPSSRKAAPVFLSQERVRRGPLPPGGATAPHPGPGDSSPATGYGEGDPGTE